MEYCRCVGNQSYQGQEVDGYDRIMVLRNHLDHVIQSRMRLVVIAILMIVVIIVIVMRTIRCGLRRDIRVHLREQMNAEVADVEDKQQHRQHTRPPRDRPRPDKAGFRRFMQAGFHDELPMLIYGLNSRLQKECQTDSSSSLRLEQPDLGWIRAAIRYRKLLTK
jgi:hypothetical protein